MELRAGSHAICSTEGKRCAPYALASRGGCHRQGLKSEVKVAKTDEVCVVRHQLAAHIGI